MAWFTTDDLTEYLATAGGFLRSRPVENTVPLTVLEVLRARGAAAFGDAAPLFGWWRRAGGVSGTFLLTPPYPVALSRTPPESVEPLADVLASAGRPLAGLSAEPATAEAFAAAWRRRTGTTPETSMRQRLFRLVELVPPAPVPCGRARAAQSADRGLLVAWVAAFTKEAGARAANHEDMVDDRLSYGGLTLWEDEGQPVSLAGLTRQVAGMIRVGPVYTPPQHRRHGYGGGVTAAVSRQALQAGAGEVVLFTDLANPTSNALYQRLGYHTVQDRVDLSFAN
jgi:predicted GNAT family acetyltransferase